MDECISLHVCFYSFFVVIYCHFDNITRQFINCRKLRCITIMIRTQYWIQLPYEFCVKKSPQTHNELSLYHYHYQILCCWKFNLTFKMTTISTAQHQCAHAHTHQLSLNLQSTLFINTKFQFVVQMIDNMFTLERAHKREIPIWMRIINRWA